MRERGGAPSRLLTTVFFTDMVGSTERAAELGDRRWRELMARYHRTVREELRRHGGRELDSAGDGFFATFGQPADAIACAEGIATRVEPLGVEVRSGVHIGQVEVLGAKVTGLGVHIGARLVGLAAPGEIVVSRTVRDALAGSEHAFEDRGEHALKGVPGEWHLYAVRRPAAERTTVPQPGPERERTTASRRRRVVLGVGVAAAVLAVAGTSAAWVATRHGGSPPPPPVVPAANQAAEVAADGESFERAVNIGSERPVGIVNTGSVVWIINASQTLTRIDTASGGTKTFGLGGTPTGIAVTSGVVWVTVAVGLSTGAEGSVLRFDATDGSELKAIGMTDGVAGIAAGENAVWVTNQLSDTVTRIDVATLSLGTAVPVGGVPRAVAVAGGSVWVANGLDKSVTRVDEQKGTAYPPVSVAGADAIATDGSTVWVAGTASNTVARIDAATGTLVTSLDVPPGPIAIALGTNTVWVAEGAAAELTRIDPATNTVVGHLHVRDQPAALASLGGEIWVAITG